MHTLTGAIKGDNPRLLCQDCSTPLFRWFLSRVEWVGMLKQINRS